MTIKMERFNLNLATQRKFGMNCPVDLAYQLLPPRFSNLLNVQHLRMWLTYSGMNEDKRAISSGAAEITGALCAFRSANQLEGEPDGIKRLFAQFSIIQDSFEKLRNLYEKQDVRTKPDMRRLK